MSIESLLQDLIEAVNANTAAMTCGIPASPQGVDEKPEKPEKSKGKNKSKGKGKAGSNGKKVTVESVKALAKKIALACDDPKDCMTQIREVVSIVAETCYDDSSRGIDQFDDEGLNLLNVELNGFEYNPAEPEEETDNLDI